MCVLVRRTDESGKAMVVFGGLGRRRKRTSDAQGVGGAVGGGGVEVSGT